MADGDSITVLRDREQVKVRLVDIDAPEMAQPFGNRAKQALDALVYGRDVLVVERGKDRYRRVLGRVYRDDLDVNVEMVREGMAWVYRTYSSDAALPKIETEAKEQQRGLWHDAHPVPPWEWRQDRHRDWPRGTATPDKRELRRSRFGHPPPTPRAILGGRRSDPPPLPAAGKNLPREIRGACGSYRKVSPANR